MNDEKNSKVKYWVKDVPYILVNSDRYYLLHPQTTVYFFLRKNEYMCLVSECSEINNNNQVKFLLLPNLNKCGLQIQNLFYTFISEDEKFTFESIDKTINDTYYFDKYSICINGEVVEKKNFYYKSTPLIKIIVDEFTIPILYMYPFGNNEKIIDLDSNISIFDSIYHLLYYYISTRKGEVSDMKRINSRSSVDANIKIKDFVKSFLLFNRKFMNRGRFTYEKKFNDNNYYDSIKNIVKNTVSISPDNMVKNRLDKYTNFTFVDKYYDFPKFDESTDFESIFYFYESRIGENFVYEYSQKEYNYRRNDNGNVLLGYKIYKVPYRVLPFLTNMNRYIYDFDEISLENLCFIRGIKIYDDEIREDLIKKNIEWEKKYLPHYFYIHKNKIVYPNFQKIKKIPYIS